MYTERMFIRFILSGVMIFFSLSTHATMSHCVSPFVEIRILYEPAIVNHETSVAELTAHIGAAHPVIGLYRSHQQIQANISKRDYNILNSLCVNNFILTYVISHAIYISKEHAPETCTYQQTLAHEKSHERIHIEKAKEASEYLRSKLSKQVFKFTGPNRVDDVQHWLEYKVEYASSVFDNFIKPAQLEFDKKEEYERFSYSC